MYMQLAIHCISRKGFSSLLMDSHPRSQAARVIVGGVQVAHDAGVVLAIHRIPCAQSHQGVIVKLQVEYAIRQGRSQAAPHIAIPHGNTLRWHMPCEPKPATHEELAFLHGQLESAWRGLV